MYRRSALLLVSLWEAAAGQAPASPPKPISSLTIVLRSDSAVPPPVLNSMEREVESLAAPSGIRITWALDTDELQPSQRVAVLTLRGVCRPDASLPAAMQIAKGGVIPLGQTLVADGEVLPFADVRCDPIRALMCRELFARPSNQRERFLGRALGRVMAHEMYHILLRTRSHGTTGLARPAQSGVDLMADRDAFALSDEHKLSLLNSDGSTGSFAADR